MIKIPLYMDDSTAITEISDRLFRWNTEDPSSPKIVLHLVDYEDIVRQVLGVDHPGGMFSGAI
jgi:hypothetical protein